MKVLYFIQTHKNPEQIYRLVKIIRRSSPESYILVSHDFTSCNLDTKLIKSLPGVEVLKLNGKGGRGDFSMIQGYLDAVDWLLKHNIKFDWLINLSGQDFPTQPLSRIEQFLAQTRYDGFLDYFEAFSDRDRNPWTIEEGSNRYLYQYWRSGICVSSRSLIGKILNRFKLVINNIQPFLRVYLCFDSLMVGWRAKNHPFNENFICYGGYYFNTLSRECVQFIYDFYRKNTQVVEYYKNTCVPVESFIQTVLINSKKFNLCNDSKRYFDFYNCQGGSPRTLTVQDYPILIKNGIHFARKFELTQGSQILDKLEARIIEDKLIENNQ